MMCSQIQLVVNPPPLYTNQAQNNSSLLSLNRVKNAFLCLYLAALNSAFGIKQLIYLEN